MGRITQFAIENSRVTILVLACIVIVGIQAFLTMPSREDPEITVRDAQVSVYFPGMPVDQVENLIAKPLEKKINEIPEIVEINTTVKTGEVLIKPKVGDSYFDLAPIWQDLRNKMDDVIKDLPEGSIGPIVNDDFGRVSSATISMTGDGFTMKELREIALYMQDRINAMDCVDKVDVMGIQEERIYLEINAARLAYYGFSFGSIVQELNDQNVVLPGGSINAEGRIIVIEPSGNFRTIEDIKNIQVQVPDTEQVVYLQDIADVRRSYVEPSEYAAFFNDRPAVILAVSMVPRYNIEDFGQQVTTEIHELQKELPVGIELDYATYQPSLVKKAVDSAVNNLFQTVVVVLIVVIVFLGVRTGILVSTIVPLTILLSFIAMGIWGIDLQRMSIAAIIISLGLLVDNGIVITEDIQRRLDMGADKREAAVNAAQSLGVPLLTSSLTTILAFMPLMMADDVSGEYLRSLSQVVIIALLSSWFLAMFAAPTFCYWFLDEKKQVKDAEQKPSSYNGRMYMVYRAILEKLMRYRVRFIAFLVAALILAVNGFSLIPKQMMPYSDRNQFLVYIDMPAGTHIDETTKVTRRLTRWLSDSRANPDIKSNIAYMGYGGPRFFLTLSPPNPGNNAAFLVVNTNTTEEVIPAMAKVDSFILENLPEARGRSKRMSLGAGEIGIVEYKITGQDVTKLYRIARSIENEMNGISGTVDVKNDWNEPVIRTRVEVDQDRARRAGVTSKSIANALNAYFEGVQISDFREGDKIIPIVVQGDETRDDWSGLRTLPIRAENGESVTLMQIADFKGYIAPGKLIRQNQERTLTVSCLHTTMQAAELHALLWPFIQTLTLPDGYDIDVGGEIESSEKGNSALAANLPYALLGMIVLLVIQFNSFRRPAIIMLTIPLVIIGAVLGLFVSRAFLSFTAILGIYSLVGIIMNNGIVLIDRIDLERTRGLGVREAIFEACLARLRPILITTLTTILGLVPLALFGGAMWYPMAWAIMGGLAVGTILTLGFVPVLYSLFFRET